MNKLKVEKNEAVISALVQGNSIRSIEHMTDIQYPQGCNYAFVR